MPDVKPPTTPALRKDTTTTTAPVDHGEPLLPDDEGKRIALRMRHAVVGFVDGPRDAVAEADQALEELAARLTEAMDRRRRTLRRSWQPADAAEYRPTTADTTTVDTATADTTTVDTTTADTATADTTTADTATVDTEQLRLTLRDYRELTERLLRL
ncbi:hypothetical protein [Streptomyces sp. NPDC050263]|uniref:hypothetical protein n=1 Tax=Streptomyces sp. NPDC050263 TaxID=3155037 RepID=UPI00341B4B16